MINENGTQMYMPVAPAYTPSYSGYGNCGMGFGGDGWWLILLLLVFGNGGFGGYGNSNNLFPWLMNGQAGINANTNAGFDNAAINSQLSGIQSSITNGFGNVELGAANRAMDSLQTNYQGQIEALNRSFAEQTANAQAFNSLSTQLCDCCCENRASIADLKFTVAQENCADRQAVSDGIRDVITAQTTGTQRILDKLCDQELQAERRENDQLRTQLNMANLAASQAAQTASLIADNTQQTQYIVNRVAPYPIPAYPVSNPYGFWNGGWNNGFGNVGFGNGSF